ncbi:hypothetical protein, partial [Burkholderia cenocepacia]
EAISPATSEVGPLISVSLKSKTVVAYGEKIRDVSDFVNFAGRVINQFESQFARLHVVLENVVRVFFANSGSELDVVALGVNITSHLVAGQNRDDIPTMRLYRTDRGLHASFENKLPSGGGRVEPVENISELGLVQHLRRHEKKVHIDV